MIVRDIARRGKENERREQRLVLHSRERERESNPLDKRLFTLRRRFGLSGGTMKIFRLALFSASFVVASKKAHEGRHTRGASNTTFGNESRKKRNG